MFSLFKTTAATPADGLVVALFRVQAIARFDPDGTMRDGLVIRATGHARDEPAPTASSLRIWRNLTRSLRRAG